MLDKASAHTMENSLLYRPAVPQMLPARGGMRVPVQVYASDRLPLSEEEIASLQRIARLAGVAQIVALPDLHCKPQMETPSSMAVAMRETIVLGLSSPSPGCGMALAITPLSEEDISEQRLSHLFTQLAKKLPLEREHLVSSVRDIRPVLLQGAAAAARHFDLDHTQLLTIEGRGNALAAALEAADQEEVLRSIPNQFFPLALKDFGMIGRGNHFLELQVVDELLDKEIAQQWGVQPRQIVVMYHADSGRLGALLGRLYAHRRKNTRRGRWLEIRYKAAYHLAHARGWRDIYWRGCYYFLPRRHSAIPANSKEAIQAQHALAAASNYAFANRIAILAALREGVRSVWGEGLEAPSLLVDSPHNGIRLEEVNGERLWVHRHNASRALPAGHPDLAGGPYYSTGQPLLLPGTNHTASYLAVASTGVANSLYSVDHGAGRSASSLGKELQGSGEVTRLYDYQRGFTRNQPHVTKEGIEEVMAVLKQADLARPVARLRPIAVLKDST
jgi:tRNA-splicing ligase RtcB (3'-phosphate/5'-hydroxy nucleic acid ligase)